MTNRPRPDVLRYAAFADGPDGGNPAGIVTEAMGLDEGEMLAIAADVGYAETAFLVAGDPSDRTAGIRYFSPIAEVPFCGHATIATAVVLAERHGTGRFVFETAVGEVAIETTVDGSGALVATFTSVVPEVLPFEAGVLEALLDLLGLTAADLDPAHPAAVAFAGNRHPIVPVADAAVFDGFRFDPAAVRRLMDEQGWRGTVTVLHPLGAGSFEARNLFPVGRITEDPATGSAAAALGGYLRDMGLVSAPTQVEVRQGRHVGKPSLLLVDIPITGGISVSGGATPILD